MTRVFSAMAHRIFGRGNEARGGCGCLSLFPLAPRSGERVPEHSEGGRGALDCRKNPLPAARSCRSLSHPLPQAEEGKEEFAARLSLHLVLSKKSQRCAAGFEQGAGCPWSISAP